MDKKSINNYARAIDVARNAITKDTKDMQLQQLQVLLIVGVYDPEPVSHQKIEHMTGMAKSTAGRNINLLSKYTVKVGNRRVQGHGVVNSRPDYEEPKKYVVELTTKGRNVLKKISKALLEDWYGSV